MKKGIYLLATLFMALLLQGCKSDITQVSQTGYFFDTTITIKLYESGKKPLLSQNAPKEYNDKTTEELLARCFELCAGYEQIFSRTMEGSDVWNINHSKGALVEVEPDTTKLIKDCISLSEQTEGVFDITISPLSEKWGFSSQALTDSSIVKTPPTEDEISELLSHVDYKNIVIQDDTHVKLADPAGAIDLGAAAKGFIADKLKDELKSMGVESGIIDLGGNILCIGKKPDGASFNLGVEDPFGGLSLNDVLSTPAGKIPTGKILSTIRVEDTSLVTSGIYHRYYVYNNRLYHHLLDTATGYPKENDLLSLTIICDSSQWADMYATAFFLCGSEKGPQLAEETAGVEALFITKNRELITTSGWPKEQK